MSEVQLINPLPSALAHYESELSQTLLRTGYSPVISDIEAVENVDGNLSRIRLLRRALKNPRIVRHSESPSLVTWPSLGLIDARLWVSRRARIGVVLHDPVPLRPQVGFGVLSRVFAALPRRLGAPLIISHSRDASLVAQRLLPHHDHIQVGHPVLTDQKRGEKSPTPTVVVAGQFKPKRNLAILRQLGPRLHAAGIQCRIHGRGWPEVPGWEVDSRFLSENDLDRVLESAWAVILPYNLYFQSGIAVRALELGTLAVSPPTSFAYEIAPVETVVNDTQSVDAWEDSILWAISNSASSTAQFDNFRDRVDRGWRDLMHDLASTRTGR